MPVYFFHFVQDDQRCPDHDGIEQPDLTGVRNAAIAGARGLIAEAVTHGDIAYDGRFEVEDEHGEKVLTLTFGFTAEIEVVEPQSA